MSRALTPTLEEAESAIVAALKADATIAAYTSEIHPFGGTLVQALQEGAYRDPSILVVFTGGEAIELGHLDHKFTLEWTVIVRARSLRGNAYQRAPSSATEIGAYQMVEDVLRVLTLADFDLDGLSPLRPLGVELLKASEVPGRSISAYQVAFEADHELCEEAPDDGLETIATTTETTNSEGEWTDVLEGSADVS